MVTISASKIPKFGAYTSSQMRYATAYVVITLIVLVFLNIYCAKANEQLFRQSKFTALQEIAHLTADQIAATGQVNSASAHYIVSRTGSRFAQVLVTDEQGSTLYDSGADSAFDPDISREIDTVLKTKEVSFSWYYHRGQMKASITVPIYHDRELAGCVYMLEIDSYDGNLLLSLQQSILTTTLALGLFLIIFSALYVRRYGRRMKEITASMKVIQEGDFSHKIDMHGRDELALLAEEFNYLTERLQISENKRRQFVSDASHELKTPLASIKLLSDSILQYDMDMETVREFAGDIGNEADRLNRMTMKLLALTKDEDDTALEDAEIIYMSPTVERVVKMLTSIAERNHVSISLDLKHDSPVLIHEDDLYQIIFNLVENGIKYNVPGGSLAISLHRQEDMAILRIADSGVGIPPEALGHVFERFYRVDKDRSRQSGGSGLGLAIVRAMVKRCNGDIHLQSTVGKGTVFTVAFPCFDEMDDAGEISVNTNASEVL